MFLDLALQIQFPTGPAASIEWKQGYQVTVQVAQNVPTALILEFFLTILNFFFVIPIFLEQGDWTR